MSKKVELSKSAIENIFRLRADRMPYKKIAERYPCSDKYIRDIIQRTAYGHVELDAGLVMAAQGAKAKWQRKKKAPEVKHESTPLEKFEPLAQLMAAQKALLDAYTQCRAVGLSKAFIDLALEEVGSLDDQ